MNPRLPSAIFALPLVLLPLPQRRQKPKAWIDPAKAAQDPDFAVQGEYAKQGAGLQVVAMSKGKFQLVAYTGGLPGLGWNGVKPVRSEVARDALLDIVRGGYQKIVRRSPTLGMTPPEGAVVLFDGKNAALGNWKKGAKVDERGLLQQGATSKATFQSGRLHLEFLLPYKPAARGQGRGNSGLYVQGRYETQMLDSFGLEGRHNECGGIYSVRRPDLNACLPPLCWQTYDIDFTAAQFDESGKKTTSARMTVRLNGVLIHDDVEVPKSTTASPLKEGAAPGPVYLQNHGNPVRYRNIWFVPKR